MKRVRLPAALVMSLAVGSGPVSGATVCYPRAEMLSYISRDFGAAREANGIVRPSSIMEVWVSRDDGDWLIVTTDLEGNSCVVAYGESYKGRLATPTEEG